MRKCLALIILILTMTTNVAYAYNDIKSNHWAYSSIKKYADSGVIVGDSSGNYYPNKVLDRFEATRILAKIAGYKDPLLNLNITAEEKVEIENAYKKYEKIIKLYENEFDMWKPIYNKEIAYMLNKGIIKTKDMPRYVIKTSSGQEKIRNITKEEVAVYLVRMVGKEEEALAKEYTSAFNDDASISDLSKPYIYYLVDKGVLKGNTKNQFSPSQSISKVIMAVMLDKGMNSSYKKEEVVITVNTGKIVQFEGTLQKVYNDKLIVLKEKEEKKLRVIKEDAITIHNEKVVKVSNMPIGSKIFGKEINGKVIEISSFMEETTEKVVVEEKKQYEDFVIVNKIEDKNERMLILRDLNGEANLYFVNSSTIYNGEFETYNFSKIESGMTIKVISEGKNIKEMYVVDNTFLKGELDSYLIARNPKIWIRVNGRLKEYNLSKALEIFKGDMEIELYNISLNEKLQFKIINDEIKYIKVNK